MNTFVNKIQPSSIVNQSNYPNNVSTGKAQANFGAELKKAIQHVNDTQVLSDKKTEQLIQGKIDNLHDVMITAQKASITLQTTVQVQRKVVDAYNEIMRMQV